MTSFTVAHALPGRVPTEFQLGALRDARLRVRQSLTVRFSQQDGQWIAEAPELNEFGSGPNQSEALVELQHAVADLYFTLEAEQSDLGSHLQGIWSTVSRKVERIG